MFGTSQSVQRFSLLLLEEGENYLHEYVVACHWPLESVSGNWKSEPVLPGTLRLCTKSLFFEADDIRVPVVRFPFKYFQSAPLANEAQKSVSICTSGLTKMKSGNLDQPYVHERQRTSHWKFDLLYAIFEKFFALLKEQIQLRDREEELEKQMEERLDRFHFDASRLIDFSEAIQYECSVTHILPLVREPGKLVVTDKRLYFQPLTSVSVHNQVRSQSLDAIGCVSRRRCSLKPRGLEVFFVPQKETGTTQWNKPCAFFDFRTTEERDVVLDHLVKLINYGEIVGGILESHSDWIQRISRLWQYGRLSNFDYLLYLNLASGRTFNDLRQWPVFPWVLKDYKSSVLDLRNPDSYRDLTKPVGALNPDRLTMFRERYREMPSDGEPPPFLYGTHYSTPGYVMFWLVRSAPAHILQLQSGKFDAPDRMFYSVLDAWESVLTNPCDVKELIPEFFLPDADFLKNKRQLALGKRQNGKSVDDVELPAWAEDAKDFLAKNRAALESEYVSAHLHHWIDLIFGYRQSGRAAEEADNVFYYLSYEGRVEIEKVQDPIERKGLEAQINEFGQTPKQLFMQPHVPKQVIPPTPNPRVIFDSGASSVSDDEGLGESEWTQCTHADKAALRTALRNLIKSRDDKDLGLTALQTSPVTPQEDEIAAEAEEEALVPERRLSSRDSIYDLVKEEYGFTRVPSGPRTSPGAKKKASTEPEPRVKNDVQIHSPLPPKPSVVDRTTSVDLSQSWCPALFRGMELCHSIDFLQGAVRAVAISPSDGGTLYCAGENAYLRMYSLQNGHQIRLARIERESGKGIPLSSLDLLPNKRSSMQPLALVGSYDNSVYAYSVETGRMAGFFKAHEEAVSVVKLLKNQKSPHRLITASRDGCVRIWNLSEGRPPWEVFSSTPCPAEIDISDHDGGITTVTDSAEESLIVCGTEEGSVTAWDLRSVRSPIWRQDYGLGSVKGLTLLPDGAHVLCGFEDGYLKLWSVKKPGELIASTQCSTTVHSCLTDGLISLHGQENGQIAMWNVGQVLGKALSILDQPLPDAQGFFPPLICKARSAVNAVCVQSIMSLQGEDVLWVAAGQENGNISVFRPR